MIAKKDGLQQAPFSLDRFQILQRLYSTDHVEICLLSLVFRFFALRFAKNDHLQSNLLVAKTL